MAESMDIDDDRKKIYTILTPGSGGIELDDTDNENGAWSMKSAALDHTYWQGKPTVDEIQIAIQQILALSQEQSPKFTAQEFMALSQTSVFDFVKLMRSSGHSVFDPLLLAYHTVMELAKKACIVPRNFADSLLNAFQIFTHYCNIYGKTESLSIATALYLEPIRPSSPVTDKTPSDEFATANLKRSFERKFEQKSLLLEPLHEKIRLMAGAWARTKYYAPYTTLVQSSGSGKTRTVVELGRGSCWLFFVCFRRPGSTGYPKRSFIADYLSEAILPQLETFREHHKIRIDIKKLLICYFLCFWTACIRELRDDLKDELPLESLENHYKDWTRRQLEANGQNGIGYDFWLPILNRSKALLNSIVCHINGSIANESLFFESVCRLAGTQLHLAYSSLSDLFPNGKRDKFMVLLGLDEASELIDLPKQSSDQGFVFRQFRHALSFWPEAITSAIIRSFCVMIDTQSRVTNLQPANLCDPSLRHIQSTRLYPTLQLYANWNLVQPNCWWENHINNMDTALLSARFQQSAFVCGRPLWNSYRDETGQIDIDYMCALAAVKLLGATGYDAIENMKGKEIPSLALLGSRFAINFHSSMQYAEEMCGSNLAACYYIFPDGKRMLCGYPSEPVVAEAAAHVSHNFPRSLGLSTQLDVLERNICNGSVEAGYRGELIAKILLIYAKDLTVISRNDKYFTSVCTVSEFLKTLCDPDKLNATLGLIGNTFNEHYSRFYNHGLLSFTHFIYVTYTPSREQMKEFFSRGAAIFCKINQAGVDCILPVYLADMKQFSYILVSVKNYSSQSNEAKLAPAKSNAQVVGNIDLPENINYPYLLLFMDVGVDLEAKIFSPTGERLSKRTGQIYKYPLTIALQGLSSDVYSCLRGKGEGDENVKIAAILCKIARKLSDPIDFIEESNDQTHFKSLAYLTYE